MFEGENYRGVHSWQNVHENKVSEFLTVCNSARDVIWRIWEILYVKFHLKPFDKILAHKNCQLYSNIGITEKPLAPYR